MISEKEDSKSKQKHCCEMMANELNHKCPDHKNPFDCPDHLIHFSEKSKDYGIIYHDGGSSFSKINYCPWCGTKLS